MLNNVAFTDLQGQSFSAAIVRVVSANRNYYHTLTRNDTLDVPFNNPQGEAIVNSEEFPNTDDSVTVRYGYWPNQAGFDAGFMYYQLYHRDAGGAYINSFTIPAATLNEDTYTGLSLEQICETYFTNVILPTMQPET